MVIDMTSIGAAIGIPLVRSIGGWVTKAAEDGKVSKFEIKLLAKTVLKTLIIGGLIFFGAEGIGIDITVVGSAASAVIFDMILSAIKENKNITKR